MTLEIYPLNDNLMQVIDKIPKYKNKFYNLQPHLVINTHAIENYDELCVESHNIKKRSHHNHRHNQPHSMPAANQNQRAYIPRNRTHNPLIEIAIFLDAPFYSKFSAAFPNNTVKIQDMVTIYMNGVQSIFHHSSLETKVDIAITQMYKIPNKFDLASENATHRANVIHPFCHYQHERKFPNDTHPKYWDIALLLTGLKIIDRNEQIILGHAVGKICSQRACIAVRVGGMNMAHAIAHEIGHV